MYAPDLYKYLDQHAGCDIFPLFIETIKGKKEAYIYVEKKLLKYNSRNKQEYNHVEDLFFDLEEFTDSDDSIELPIRGINFRNLNNSNIGVFDGYAMPDKNNKYDKYAIGIYNNAGVHYGFIEKGQKDLYNLIEAGKGYVDATLDVTTFVNDMGETKFSGTVTINKNDIV